jgi:FixJ family two-component response regulator
VSALCGARYESPSARERQVIGLVTAGLMEQQVAAETLVSPRSRLKIHRSHIIKTLKSTCSMQAISHWKATDLKSRQLSATSSPASCRKS